MQFIEYLLPFPSFFSVRIAVVVVVAVVVAVLSLTRFIFLSSVHTFFTHSLGFTIQLFFHPRQKVSVALVFV